MAVTITRKARAPARKIKLRGNVDTTDASAKLATTPAPRARPQVPEGTEESILKAIAAGQLKRVDAPSFAASSVTIAATTNDWILTFQQAHPAVVSTQPGVIASIAIMEPTVVLHLGPGTAKDLSLLLSREIVKYEKTNGPVETDYTRLLAKQN